MALAFVSVLTLSLHRSQASAISFRHVHPRCGTGGHAQIARETPVQMHDFAQQGSPCSTNALSTGYLPARHEVTAHDLCCRSPGEVNYRKQKTRFFQLSADGSTLRWGWKKHVLLFHVDEMECNDDDLSIKLVMTVDRDLIITFPDRYTCAAVCSHCPLQSLHNAPKPSPDCNGRDCAATCLPSMCAASPPCNSWLNPRSRSTLRIWQ